MKCLNSIKNLSAAEVKHLWEKGQIRGLILTSLVIQALLTFLAPRRKRNSKSYLMPLIWVLYLSADVVAVYIIGLISSNRNHSAQKELQAFWAPFLLLHLGGPDTITALAMEDNELWHRHALQLATQVLVTIYVFVRSLRHNSLWIPTILMFVVGFTKYYERTCALFYASSDNFRDSLRTTPEPGPNYARLMEEYFSAKCAHIPSEFDVEHGQSENLDQKLQGDGGLDENLSSGGNNTGTSEATDPEYHVKIVSEAHDFYEMFKPLLADGFLSLKDRDWSRNIFLKRNVHMLAFYAFYWLLQDDYFLASEFLSPWTVDIDYDESLLIWHLATDICFWTASSNNQSPETENYKLISKSLSDYMLYLIMWQQKLLSSVVGMSDTRFEDTCAEATKFMNKKLNISWHQDSWWNPKKFRSTNTPGQSYENPEEQESKFFREFSARVLGVKAEVEPIVAKGDKSKSVLFDACRLAKQLQLFGEEEQWKITSKVWVELLCYAAVRCSPRSHIAQLSQGGELITFVWLYMAHLGLGERFLQNQGFGRTRLIIHK
uniref:DUF4220 domain-containing protein n=1 Tax=Chenopodium quinoa TaxID=63459 RepID=A0A803LSD5_CHEQI